MKKMALFISGTGGNALNLLEACREGRVPAEPVLVVASSPKASGAEKLRQAGLLVVTMEKGASDDGAYSERLFGLAEAAEADLICLGGWLRKLVIPSAWEGRVLNIHPSLLPMFGGAGMYGLHVHRAVLAAGETESGCTVHLVDNEFDHGKILAQSKVPVMPGDTPETLQQRVYTAEMELYPAVVSEYLSL